MYSRDRRKKLNSKKIRRRKIIINTVSNDGKRDLLNRDQLVVIAEDNDVQP